MKQVTHGNHRINDFAWTNLHSGDDNLVIYIGADSTIRIKQETPAEPILVV